MKYIDKYQEPYQPLNKNYPEEIMRLWWEGKDKEFLEAVKNYDDYYGKVLEEVVVPVSKTTPTKTSDWTSEHNVAEDNKKYEQAHQAESQKIASAVSNKMNEVGNTIGTTALIGGMTVPALVASPVAFAGGMLGGILGAKATDKIVDWGTNGKYNTWADLLVDKADTKYINHNIAEILNPGALVGGTVGGIFTKPAASWAYRNGKYAYNTKFKGVAKGGDMSEYVPQTIKNQVEAGVEGTRNQLKELGVDKLPYSKITYENNPIYDSNINGVGNIIIGFDSKTLKNPFKFYKAYTGGSEAGLNYGFVGGHEYAHNVHTRQFKYFNPDGTPITHPQTGEQATVYTGVHRDYPIAQQNLYKTANGPIPKEDTYYTAPDQFLEIGLFSDINTPRVNIMKGLPNTPTSRAHLRAPMEMDADLYALKNLGYIKNGKVTDEGVNFLMKRHNLTKEGVINTIDDLQLIGYGNAVSGSPINAQFRPTNQILPTSSFAESAPQTARILPTSKLTEAERLGIPKGDRNNLSESQQEAKQLGKKFLNKIGYRKVQKTVSKKPKTEVLKNHLQGDDAVTMFKEYSKDYILPSIETENIRQLRAYIPEVRERYGLVGNNKVSDEDILKALYKQVSELDGGTAARNIDEEPQLLFRGSTSRHNELIPKGSAMQDLSGADNILGNLFLGEMPYITATPADDSGVARYLGKLQGWLGPTQPQTNAAQVILPESKILDSDMYTLYNTKKFGPVKKLPGYALNTGYNDINAFIVRTPNVRNATEEIVTAGIDFNTIPQNKKLGENIFNHYRSLIKEAELKNQGLIHSKPVITKSKDGFSYGKFRDEHAGYNYFALPNFNIRNAKHILPYDFRIPRDWSNPNIYKAAIPIIGIGGLSLGLGGNSESYKQGGPIKNTKK